MAVATFATTMIRTVSPPSKEGSEEETRERELVEVMAGFSAEQRGLFQPQAIIG